VVIIAGAIGTCVLRGLSAVASVGLSGLGIAALFALIAWRIVCEAVITVFRIQARLHETIESEQTRVYNENDAEAAMAGIAAAGFTGAA